MKEAGMRIRVEQELRDAFVNACREHDIPAAQVIRAFMRDFVEQQATSVQGSLFKQFEMKDN